MNSIFKNASAPIIVLATLALSQLVTSEESKIWRFGLKYHVHMINGFHDNSKPLIVHCRSKEDDLGEHSLQVGQEFAWPFKVNILGTTLFYCNTSRGNLSKPFNAFDATLEGSVCAHDGQCYWLFSEAGIYFSVDNFTWERKLGWK